MQQAGNRQPSQWKPSAETDLSSISPASTRPGEVRGEEFLYELKAGQRAASGRPRPAGLPSAR